MYEVSYGPIILLIGLLVIVVLFYLWLNYKQKKEMIKSGMSISHPESLLLLKEKSLRNSIFCISIGLGILIARLLSVYFSFINNFMSYVGILSITGGLGLLLFYKLKK